MIEFFPGPKQAQIRSIMAGVLRGVISQRLLPKIGSGRIAAVEVMINNARISELIREDRTDEISDAIEEGEFFDMQTFTRALIDMVIAGTIDQEVAANASSNRHDFLIALEHALKKQALSGGELDEAESDEVVEAPLAEEPLPVELEVPALRVAAREH